MRRWRLIAVLVLAGAASTIPDTWLFAEGAASSHAVVPFGQPRPGSFDDGWRRTADGWENISDWQMFAYAPAELAPDDDKPYSAIPSPSHLSLVPGWRLDFHPAALALLQMAILAWLAGFASSATTRTSS